MKLKLPATFAWEWLAQVAALTGLYLPFAWLGSVVAVAPGNVLVAGPASGLAIAAVWRGGYRLVPAIGLGSFAFQQLNGMSASASTGIAFANMIEAILAVFLMRRYIAGPRPFDRVNHVFHFFLWAGLVASAPCAALGVASLGAAGNGDEFSTLWLHWWAGDVTGALVVAPVLLAWTWPGKLRRTAREWFETSVAFVILTVACVLVFGAKPMPLGGGFPGAFPILPIIVWVAARLGQRATVSATLLTCAFAVWGMLHGTGIFAATEAPLLVLHLFVGAVAMTGLVIAADVTERNDAGQAVRESDARKILGTAFDAILSIDNTGKVHEWNSAAERMFGYRRAEAVGRSMDELIVPLEARQHHLSGPADDLIAGVGSLIDRPFELMARRADAKEIPVELAITRVPASAPPTYTVTIRDLTERKKAESALRQSEERFRLLVEGVTDYAIYMLDAEGRVATWNSGAQNIEGYTAREILGKPLAAFFTSEDVQSGLPTSLLSKAAAEGRVVNEGWRVRKNGSRFWSQGILTALRDEKGKLCGFSKIAHDVTKQKEAEEQIRALNEQLEQRVSERTAELETTCKELEAFSYSVSHDLRAPLRHIAGYVRLLQDEAAARLDETDRQHLQTIAQSAANLGNLIDALLDFARTGRAALEPQPVKLATLVAAARHDLRHGIQGHSQIDWQIGHLPELQADPRLLRQVMINLLSNALKYTRNRERPRIEIGATESDDEIIVFIRDNGVGFDMKYSNKLFGVFSRLHPASEFEGIGIGLANVGRIIRRHGGRVWAQSAINQGATFFFSLPKTQKGKVPISFGTATRQG